MTGRRSTLAVLAVAIGGAAGFLALGAMVAGSGPLPIDDALAAPVEALPVPRDAWLAITALGGRAVLLAVCGALVVGLLLARRPALALLVALVFVGVTLGTDVAKELFARPRPPDASAALADGYAYPSGHALQSAVVYGVTALAALRLGPPAWAGRVAGVAAILLATAIGASRVALGVHWPSDVLGGWLAGVAIVATVSLAMTPPRPVPTTITRRG